MRGSAASWRAMDESSAEQIPGVIAAVYLGMTLQAVGEYRPGGLVVERREVGVALQAVLLGGRLPEQAFVDATVWRVAGNAAVSSGGLVGEHEGAAELLVAFHATLRAKLTVTDPRSCAVRVVTVYATHRPFEDRVVVRQVKLGLHLLVALRAFVGRILTHLVFGGRRRVAGQAGDLRLVVGAAT